MFLAGQLTENPFASTHSLDTNPFDDPENIVYTEHNFNASSVSNYEVRPSTHSHLIDPRAQHTSAECPVDDSATDKPPREEITMMWRR